MADEVFDINASEVRAKMKKVRIDNIISTLKNRVEEASTKNYQTQVTVDFDEVPHLMEYGVEIANLIEENGYKWEIRHKVTDIGLTRDYYNKLSDEVKEAYDFCWNQIGNKIRTNKDPDQNPTSGYILTLTKTQIPYYELVRDNLYEALKHDGITVQEVSKTDVHGLIHEEIQMTIKTNSIVQYLIFCVEGYVLEAIDNYESTITITDEDFIFFIDKVTRILPLIRRKNLKLMILTKSKYPHFR